jgi:hypothetical protein
MITSNNATIGTSMDAFDPYWISKNGSLSISGIDISGEPVTGEMVMVEMILDPSVDKISKDKNQIKQELTESLTQKILKSKLVEYTMQEDLKSGLITYRARAFLTPDDKVRILRREGF